MDFRSAKSVTNTGSLPLEFYGDIIQPSGFRSSKRVTIELAGTPEVSVPEGTIGENCPFGQEQ